MEAYYAVLCAKDFLDLDDLKARFSKFDSPYIGHPHNTLPGIEMNSGSLGHGLPVSVGMALAAKKDGKSNRVYVVTGDGELAEGSNWEGFMSGAMFGLDNLCCVIDRNYLQISGSTEDVMALDDLKAKVSAFGWNVIVVKDGNDLDEPKPMTYEQVLAECEDYIETGNTFFREADEQDEREGYHGVHRMEWKQLPDNAAEIMAKAIFQYYIQ